VPEDNVAVVRTFTDALRSGDISACAALLDDSSVFSEAASLPFGGDYVGAEGFRRMLGAVSRDFRVELAGLRWMDCRPRSMSVLKGIRFLW